MWPHMTPKWSGMVCMSGQFSSLNASVTHNTWSCHFCVFRRSFFLLAHCCQRARPGSLTGLWLTGGRVRRLCVSYCCRWLFLLLITVWSGEMNGSYLRWNNNPLWNPGWIGTAQDDTKKPLIRAGHSAQSSFIWWGLLQHAKKKTPW